MKITVEISDPLLHKAREMATLEGVALRTLVERGLRRVVAEAKTDAPFKLRRASFKGKGLRPALRSASRDGILSLAYGRRS
ncbi:MAG: DUF2191 domain-containing protein [Rhodospirillales bacterium]|nr:DUF2191 domain-containing protein [Rhodospirillales bacterium]